jgi:hypothetical protein
MISDAEHNFNGKVKLIREEIRGEGDFYFEFDVLRPDGSVVHRKYLVNDYEGVEDYR